MSKTYKGHNIFNNGEYYAIYWPSHHLADKKGVVLLHRCITEDILGRELNDKEVVHHEDENKYNNDPDNLKVFVNQNAHASYHKGSPIYQLENGAWDIDINRIKQYKILSVYNSWKCKICGKQISVGSILCKECNNKEKIKNNPSKSELKLLLENYNYTEIGRMYNVSSNAVKKWAKKYGLYERCFHTLPSVDEMISLLKNNNHKEICNMLKISNTTLLDWMKKLKIKEITETVYTIIETGEKYTSLHDVHNEKYSDLSYETIRTAICKAIKNNTVYKGYHWDKCTKKEIRRVK